MERRESSEAKQTSQKKRAEDDCLDDALENTFPASDPPAMTHPHRSARRPPKPEPPRKPS